MAGLINACLVASPRYRERRLVCVWHVWHTFLRLIFGGMGDGVLQSAWGDDGPRPTALPTYEIEILRGQCGVVCEKGPFLSDTSLGMALGGLRKVQLSGTHHPDQ